jgi:Ulp1 family protease
LLRAVQRRFKRGFSKLGGFLDPHGLHWAGIYVDAESKSVEYFDSCGFGPPAWAAEQMAEVASAYNFSVRVAKQQHQEGTDDCGVYWCLFLKGRLEGKSDADTRDFRRMYFQ